MEEQSKEEQAGLAGTKVGRAPVEAVRSDQEMTPQEEGAQTPDRAERATLQRDPKEIHFVPERAAVHVGATHNPARGFFSVMITGLIAATIGFGIGVYVVPAKKAAHFRAVVDRGLNSIFGAGHPNKGSNKVQPAKASRTPAPAQKETPP